MGGSFLTVDESDDVRMVEAFEDVDLGVQILFQFLVELVHIHRLDGDKAWFFLYEIRQVSRWRGWADGGVVASMIVTQRACLQ